MTFSLSEFIEELKKKIKEDEVILPRCRTFTIKIIDKLADEYRNSTKETPKKKGWGRSYGCPEDTQDEPEKIMDCPMKMRNVFPYGNVPVPDVEKLREMKNAQDRQDNSQQPSEFANIQGEEGCTEVMTSGFGGSGVSSKNSSVGVEDRQDEPSRNDCLCCKGICDCEYGCSHVHKELDANQDNDEGVDNGK